jgi:hypothetical protein
LVTTQDLNFASESLNIRHAVGVAECFPGEVERKSCMPYEKSPRRLSCFQGTLI